MNPAQLITYLNSIEIGEMDQIRGKLGEAREACNELSQHQLAEQIDEAEAALQRADVQTYRKRLETVIARLGHLK